MVQTDLDMRTGLYWNRWLVYGVLTIVGGMMLIDAFPQTTLLHARLANAIDPILDKTGLWQGNWMLFAPSPDNVNVRIGAKITWDNNVETEWRQPNWHSMSPWEKTLRFREMEYFDKLWVVREDSSVWKAFCSYLVRQQEAEAAINSNTLIDSNGRAPEERAKVIKVKLFQDRDLIPPPSKAVRKAYAEPEYSATYHLYTWLADE